MSRVTLSKARRVLASPDVKLIETVRAKGGVRFNCVVGRKRPITLHVRKGELDK